VVPFSVSQKQKPPGFWHWRFWLDSKVSLAGPVRQLAGIKEERKEEETGSSGRIQS
jgi:hypothetical protein